MPFAGQLAPKGQHTYMRMICLESLDTDIEFSTTKKVGQFACAQYAWPLIFFESSFSRIFGRSLVGCPYTRGQNFPDGKRSCYLHHVQYTLSLRRRKDSISRNLSYNTKLIWRSVKLRNNIDEYRSRIHVKLIIYLFPR